jgi:hypothetical protein
LEKVRGLEKKAHEEGCPLAVGLALRIWGEGKTLYEKRDNWIIDAEDTDTLSGSVAVSFAAQAS